MEIKVSHYFYCYLEANFNYFTAEFKLTLAIISKKTTFTAIEFRVTEVTML